MVGGCVKHMVYAKLKARGFYGDVRNYIALALSEGYFSYRRYYGSENQQLQEVSLLYA
jgi:hypothetical protein